MQLLYTRTVQPLILAAGATKAAVHCKISEIVMTNSKGLYVFGRLFSWLVGWLRLSGGCAVGAPDVGRVNCADLTIFARNEMCIFLSLMEQHRGQSAGFRKAATTTVSLNLNIFQIIN